MGGEFTESFKMGSHNGSDPQPCVKRTMVAFLFTGACSRWLFFTCSTHRTLTTYTHLGGIFFHLSLPDQKTLLACSRQSIDFSRLEGHFLGRTMSTNPES